MQEYDEQDALARLRTDIEVQTGSMPVLDAHTLDKALRLCRELLDVLDVMSEERQRELMAARIRD